MVVKINLSFFIYKPGFIIKKELPPLSSLSSSLSTFSPFDFGGYMIYLSSAQLFLFFKFLLTFIYH